MKLINALWSFFSQEPETVFKPTHIKRSGRQSRSLTHLVAHGSITLSDIGGNHPAKIAMRLRKLGYLKPRGAPGAERWETNKRTGCDFKVYIWTGKVPANWVKADTFNGLDRRSKPRGGCR